MALPIQNLMLAGMVGRGLPYSAALTLNSLVGLVLLVTLNLLLYRSEFVSAVVPHTRPAWHRCDVCALGRFPRRWGSVDNGRVDCRPSVGCHSHRPVSSRLSPRFLDWPYVAWADAVRRRRCNHLWQP
jgi:hypothetical protein